MGDNEHNLYNVIQAVENMG